VYGVRDSSEMLGTWNVMLKKALKLILYFLQASSCCLPALSAALTAVGSTTSLFDVAVSACRITTYERSRCALKCSSYTRHLASRTEYSRHTCTAVG
jgi:hypothetical protein